MSTNPNGDASRARNPFTPDRLAFTLPPEPVSAEEMAEHDRRVSPICQLFDEASALVEERLKNAARHDDSWEGLVYALAKRDEQTRRATLDWCGDSLSWLTARPVVFALGTAAGALFVLLMRGWV